MTDTARARAAHDAIQQYNLSGLIQNPPKPRRMYPLNVATVTVYWIGEWGCEVLIDDPASLGIPDEG